MATATAADLTPDAHIAQRNEHTHDACAEIGAHHRIDRRLQLEIADGDERDDKRGGERGALHDGGDQHRPHQRDEGVVAMGQNAVDPIRVLANQFERGAHDVDG